MEVADATLLSRDLLVTALWLVMPIVVVSLLVGVIVSIAQTVTSIQEQTLTFAPRIVAVVAIIIFMTPWYIATLKRFTVETFEMMVEML
ncbi:MAG: flagellar biosynthetic protein FliQ [Planctomycetota bacterium]